MELGLHRRHTAPPDDLGQLLSELDQVLAVPTSPGAGERLAYSRDLWPLLTLELSHGTAPDATPWAVARPRSEEEVLSLLEVCQARKVPVVPVGGGSGVCGGTVPTRGGIALDLKHMAALREVDERGLAAEVEPGLVSLTLEEELNARGFTLGHFPSSIAAATVGGCIAARGAGQLSSRYGKIEDMVLGLRVATPGLGLLGTGCYGSARGGPDWTQVIVGSEGTLGVVTRARLRIHRLPEARHFRGYRFRRLEDGTRAFRRCMQAGLQPSVLRLYDPADHLVHRLFSSSGHKTEGTDEAPHQAHLQPATERRPVRRLGRFVVTPGSFGDRMFRGAQRLDPRRLSPSAALSDMTKLDRLPIDRLIASPRLANKAMELGGGSCLAILGCEGAAGRSKAEFDRCRALFEEAGGEDLGPEPGWHWFERRYHISYKLPTLLQQGCMAETLEFATTWAGLPRLYEGVRQAVRGEAVVLAHFSHAYAEGCSIYFTLLAAAGNGTLAKQRYTRFWKAALDAAAAAGATASHHHGVGLMKRTYAAQEAGEALALYRAAKRSIDPEGILNPDKLFPTEGS